VLPTFIRHGDLVLEFEGDGSLRITRQSNAQAVQVSSSEWIYLLKVAELHDWPIAPPTDIHGNAVQS
jgi:hypothetical protein